jgi:hypothetical protein
MADTIVTRTLEKTPSQLYKYCGVRNGRIDWIKRYLLSSELYFAPMTCFNDPLDCRIPMSFDASPEIAEEYWKKIAPLAAPHESPEERDKHVAELIQKTKTNAGREQLTEIQFRNFAKHGILSLTKHPDSMLMWSYYADSHSGIVLRFNMGPANLVALASTIECVMVEVVYQSDFPIINFYGDDTEKIYALIGTKALDWAHEHEWRIVLVNRTGHVRIPSEMIDGIIFGLRTNPDDETLIRSWVHERKEATELLRVKYKSRSFELEIVSA